METKHKLANAAYAIDDDPSNYTDKLIYNYPQDNASDSNIVLQATWPLSDEKEDEWILPNLTDDEIQSAIQNGTKALGDKELFEENMSSPAVNSPSFKHQRAVSTTQEARIVSRRGFVENHATSEIAKK